MRKGVKSMNFIIPLHIYPFDVMVSIGEIDDLLFKKLLSLNVGKEELEHAKFEDIVGRGRYCMFECGASLIRIKKRPKNAIEFGVLSHEIFHAVVSIMWKIGMKLEISASDEAYAYLIGYLTDQIYAKIFS